MADTVIRIKKYNFFVDINCRIPGVPVAQPGNPISNRISAPTMIESESTDKTIKARIDMILLPFLQEIQF